MSDINEVSKKFNDLLQQLGVVTMMVERPYTLNTSPNPTTTAPVKVGINNNNSSNININKNQHKSV